MRAVVVALGKIGLPLAAQIARAGHEVVGCDVDAARRASWSTRGARAVPRRGRAGGGARGGRRRRAPARADGHHGRGRRGRRPRRRRAAAGRRRATRSRTGAILDAVVADIGARRCSAGHRPSCDRDDGAGRHDARAHRAGARGRQRAASASADFFAVFSPERVFSGRVFARPRARYPKLVGGLSDARRGARRRAVRARSSSAEVWPMGSRRGGRAGEARRDDLPRPQHRASPTSSARTPTRSASTSTA